MVGVRATGLCRSDWHAWAGHDDISAAARAGARAGGRRRRDGAGCRAGRPGDRVTVPFVEGCGRCAWCRSGNAQVCPDQQQPGFTHWGSFAQYVALHAADINLVAIPEAVPSEAAAWLGCRFATAYRALTGRARLAAGEWVTVIGAGGVGLSAVMIAKALGARVIAVDRNPGALEVAAALGADHVLAADGAAAIPGAGPRGHRRRQPRRRRRGRQRADVRGLDPLPAPPRPARAGRPAARRCGHPRLPMARVIGWELDLLGSHGMAAADYPGMLALIERGDLRPQDLIERVISLEEAAALLPRSTRPPRPG